MSKIFLFLFPLFLFADSVFPEYVSRTQNAMGTFVEIKIERIPGAEQLLAQAFKKIAQLEDKLSLYGKNSEIVRLNREKKCAVSFETLEVVRQSIYVSQITNGAFDITCQPLIILYSEASEKNTMPSRRDIEKTLENVGWGKIKISGNVISILPGMAVNVSGIAKGYIIDKVVSFLKGKGVDSGIVNAGGDIFCFGKNPGGGKWSIGIRNPFDRKAVVETLRIAQGAVATSGNYERYLRIKKSKVGHILDPRTGKGADDFPVSVTVIAKNCAIADALATGCFVLGKNESMQVVEGLPGVEVLIIEKNGKFYRSSGFSEFTSP
jgi:FAD:protein FMN transferase